MEVVQKEQNDTCIFFRRFKVFLLSLLLLVYFSRSLLEFQNKHFELVRLKQLHESP